LTNELGAGHARTHRRQINILSVQKEFVNDRPKQNTEFKTTHYLKRSASLPSPMHKALANQNKEKIKAEMSTQTDESCLNEPPKTLPCDKPQRPTTLHQANHVKILLKHQLTRDSGIDGDQMQHTFKSTETIPELRSSTSQSETKTSQRSKECQARKGKLLSSTRDNSMDQEYANESTSSDLNESLLAEDIMVNLFNRNVLDDDEEEQVDYDHLNELNVEDRTDSSSANEDDEELKSTGALIRNAKGKRIQQRSFEVVSTKRQMFKGKSYFSFT